MTSAPDQASLSTLSVGTAGPRIAFLHGLFGQGRNWNQIAKAVSGPDGTDARCLLVDLPDHGRSPWSQEFSLDAYADAVAATLRAAAAEGARGPSSATRSAARSRWCSRCATPSSSTGSSSSTSRPRATARSSGSRATSARCRPCRSAS